MIDYMLESSERMQDVMLSDILYDTALKVSQEEFDEIIIIAHGSSYNAAMMVLNIIKLLSNISVIIL